MSSTILSTSPYVRLCRVSTRPLPSADHRVLEQKRSSRENTKRILTRMKAPGFASLPSFASFRGKRTRILRHCPRRLRHGVRFCVIPGQRGCINLHQLALLPAARDGRDANDGNSGGGPRWMKAIERRNRKPDLQGARLPGVTRSPSIACHRALEQIVKLQTESADRFGVAHSEVFDQVFLATAQ